ncbi:hypothetical protein TNIN_381361 [Trichonephila inaurata madagascariensis]|uniref:Uncharacterized protein n=1 Tax=Trichonephila inaurata madagascariensis TaxID=2747483 RepID=A0A8X7CJN5_9ARAC|nr:hypothetical protein TNIN_381361 [Trichonephila inaurata madagascariensis]
MYRNVTNRFGPTKGWASARPSSLSVVGLSHNPLPTVAIGDRRSVTVSDTLRTIEPPGESQLTGRSRSPGRLNSSFLESALWITRLKLVPPPCSSFLLFLVRSAEAKRWWILEMPCVWSV